MDILFLMVPAAILIALVFVLAFIWATKKGQYDDLETPAHKMLIEDDLVSKKINSLTKEKEMS